MRASLLVCCRVHMETVVRSLLHNVETLAEMWRKERRRGLVSETVGQTPSKEKRDGNRKKEKEKEKR